MAEPVVLRRPFVLGGVLLLLLILLPVHRPAGAVADPSASAGQWAAVAQKISDQLDGAGTAFHDGDAEGARSRVKEARYSTYVGSGFEEALGAKSGADVKDTDMDFALLVQAIKDNTRTRSTARSTSSRSSSRTPPRPSTAPRRTSPTWRSAPASGARSPRR